jgi:hypothetical protein
MNRLNGCLKRTHNISITERIVDRDLLEVTRKPKDCIVYASNYRGVMCNVFVFQSCLLDNTLCNWLRGTEYLLHRSSGFSQNNNKT